MTKPSYVSGDIPTATEVNEFMVNVNYVRKTANESVTLSTTLQNDDALTLPVLASAEYRVTLGLWYDGPQLADLKFAFTVPAGGTLNGALVFIPTSAAGTYEAQINGGDLTAANSIGTQGSGVAAWALVEGVLTTSSAGSLTLQWSQSTSNGTAVRVLAGSFLDLRRVS